MLKYYWYDASTVSEDKNENKYAQKVGRGAPEIRAAENEGRNSIQEVTHP